MPASIIVDMLNTFQDEIDDEPGPAAQHDHVAQHAT